jgi:hypothetical protein
VNFSRLRLVIGLAIVFGIATATAGFAQYNANPDSPISPPVATLAPNTTAPPLAPVTPVPSTAPGAPTPAPSGGPRRGRRAPGPAASGSPAPSSSGTPEPPQFTTLDGVWEIEIQPLGHRLATYSHLGITSTGATVVGYWEHDPKKLRSPMTGSFDGRLISLQITLPNGNTASFSGYVENFADMVGIFRANDKDTGVAFTAEHRKKLKG